MAAGLAAAIENRFGLQAELVEGHNGIYEIAVNGRLVYSNQTCEHPPLEEEVFAEIAKHSSPVSVSNLSGDSQSDVADLPFCTWTPPAAN